MDERDLIVIGGGAAGFLAAYRASQFGGKVTLVEKEELGGTCTNWGCIPMQFLLGNLMLVQLIKKAKENGINVGKVSIDYSRLISAKNAAIKFRIDRMQSKLKTVNLSYLGRFRINQIYLIDAKIQGAFISDIQAAEEIGF